MPQGFESRGGVSAPAADNIRTIVELERETSREATFSERIGDRICRLIGNLTFVLLQGLMFATWIGWNVAAPEGLRFDPYPHVLLTFVVSLEGMLIATFVLIAQNRLTRESEQRNHLNLQISLLAEQEMTIMLRMLRRVATHLQVQPESADLETAEKLTESTNVYELMREIKKELPHDDE